MKKTICILIVVSFLIAFSSICTFAEEAETDPYYEYHLQISYKIDELREQRNNQIEPLHDQIKNYRNESMQLYNENSSTYSQMDQIVYDKLIDSITELEEKITAIEKQYYEDVEEYLISVGMQIVDEFSSSYENTDIHLSATDVGYMQTNSSTLYSNSTDEFFYFVEYDYAQTSLGSYLGLNDLWGDYDLVSMQHKENSDWYWDNIIVTANYAQGFYGNPDATLAGKADKYQILENNVSGVSAVSNREDFWNGCIFNVSDKQIKNTALSYSSEIRYVTLEGWLKPTGDSTVTHVKSEYEHNYQTWVLASVVLGSTNLNDDEFSLEITYVKSSGAWRRSAGSRICAIPE